MRTRGRRTTASASVARRRRRRPVRHQHAQQALGPDRLGDEVRHERRVDAARQPQDRRSKPAWRSWPRMNSPMTRRATSVSMASSVGSSKAGRAAAALTTPPRPGRNPMGCGVGSPGATSSPGSAPGSLVVSRASPARSAMIRASSRTCSSGRSSRSSGRPIRSRRMSAERDVDGEQALVVERRAEQRRPVRRDDLRAAPERDRLVDADPVAEDDERGRQLGVRAHQRPPRRRRPEADLVGRGQVAPGRRRHVDEDLGAVEGEQLRARTGARSPRTRRCPSPTPRRDGTARSRSPAAKKRRSSNRP